MKSTSGRASKYDCHFTKIALAKLLTDTTLLEKVSSFSDTGPTNVVSFEIVSITEIENERLKMNTRVGIILIRNPKWLFGSPYLEVVSAIMKKIPDE